MFKQPIAIASLAASAVIAQHAIAQTPSAVAAQSGALPGSAEPLVEDTEEPESPVDNAESLVAVGEYLEAINIVELEIDKIERRSNRYNVELAKPLVVLGDALAGVGDREGALGAYDRAVHITRVNRGLHHPSQVDIVYREAGVLAANGDAVRANRRHEYAYDILLRSYGGSNPMMLPGIFSLADWYLVNYNIFSARGLYSHALALADESLEADDPQRLRALRGIAASYRSERFPPYQGERKPSSTQQVSYRYGTMPVINNFGKGERALIEVAHALTAGDSATDEDVAAAFLELADWYLVFGKNERATALYARVWELLTPNQDLLAATFDAPTPLYLPLPGDPDNDGVAVGRPRTGVVELSFRVDESGGVSGVAILRSDPQDLMDVPVRRAVRRALYRPAFDGQSTLATEDVRVSHEFMYYPTDDLPSDSGSQELPDAANHPGGTTPEPGSSRKPTGLSSGCLIRKELAMTRHLLWSIHTQTLTNAARSRPAALAVVLGVVLAGCVVNLPSAQRQGYRTRFRAAPAGARRHRARHRCPHRRRCLRRRCRRRHRCPPRPCHRHRPCLPHRHRPAAATAAAAPASFRHRAAVPNRAAAVACRRPAAVAKPAAAATKPVARRAVGRSTKRALLPATTAQDLNR